jgi:hypothetical protein
MADPFKSPKTRLKRANEHIRRLEKRTNSFFKSVPYTAIVELDPDGVHRLHKIRFGKSLPSRCEIDAAEAIEALRSVLDQIGYATAVLAGQLGATATKFPFGDTETDVENDIKRGCKHLLPEFQALVRSFKPYCGGNDTLWSLNKLRNPGYHKALLALSVPVSQIHFRHAEIEGPVQIMPVWDGDKNEITLARSEIGSQFKHDARVSVFISFGEPAPVRLQPAVGVLRTMAREVQRILLATKAEATRIRLIK